MTKTTPDLLKLYNDREFEKIEAILDSTEYTKTEKIAMITTEYQDTRQARRSREAAQLGVVIKKKNLFSELCVYVDDYNWEAERVELLVKVLRIFGENLGNYVDDLKKIVSMNHEDGHERLVRVIVEELSDFEFTDVLTSLLVRSFGYSSVGIVNVLLSSESLKQNILTEESIRYKYDTSTEQTSKICLCSDDNDALDTDYIFFKHLDDYVFYNHATLLEIALHKHADPQIIRALVRVGGKDLLLLSERSLIQGAILEYNKYNNTDETVEIVKLFLEVGGKELLTKEKSWHHESRTEYQAWMRYRYRGLDIFEYLCKDRKYYLNNGVVAKVITMLLDTGGKDLVMKKNEEGQTILHYFEYFNHHSFISVVEKIKEIGGVDLLSITDDNGDTVLHILAKYYLYNKPNDMMGLEWWEILACDRNLVMIQNKRGKTALHVACENSEGNAIKVLVEKGGKDLVWKRDKQKNTALHLLQFRVSREKDANNFQALKHIVEAGGMELLHSLNNKEKKPLSPFFIDALEFQFDEENRPEKVKALQEEAELDKKAKLDLMKQLQVVQKKNASLELKLKQSSGNELTNVVKSLKNKLKHQKKNNEDTIKELQKEKMKDKTKAGIIRLKNKIKQLQGIEQSLQSKIQEQQVVIENLQNERKQAELEFEIVKNMHEENKSAYEKSLVEVRNLKKVEKSQQDDIFDQKEMIQNLQYKLRNLETENQRMRDMNGKEEVSYSDKPFSMQEESQRLIEEVKANIEEESPVENREVSLEEEIQALKEAVKEQKQIAEEKQKENNTLKDENQRLIDKIATYSLKRSRDEEKEEIDCIEEDVDDICCPPTKRGKTTACSSESGTSENTRDEVKALESEIEELTKDLECEKSNHMKTLKRLREARKSSKKH